MNVRKLKNFLNEEKNSKREKSSNSNNIASANYGDSDDDLALAHTCSEDLSDEWVLDYGCTAHIGVF